jgi:mono/diheme cytochrome c family protein
MKRFLVGGVGSLVITTFSGVLLSAAFSAHAAEVKATTTVTKVAAASSSPDIERGRYLVKIGGCNDCHTPGFAQANGKIDEQHWLTGDAVGWQGGWGTTFPINVRLFAGSMTEDQWVTITRNSQAKPPMPVWVFKDLTDRDLRALYRYIKSLGVAGTAAPQYLPPGTTTKNPVIKFPE